MGIVIDFKTREVLGRTNKEEINSDQAKAKRRTEALAYAEVLEDILVEMVEDKYDITNMVLLIPRNGSVALVNANTLTTGEQMMRTLEAAIEKLKETQLYGEDNLDDPA